MSQVLFEGQVRTWLVGLGRSPVSFRADTNPGRHEMLIATQPAMARLTVNGAWCEALFASTLQPSDSPTADVVTQAIKWTLRQFGVRADGTGVRRPPRRGRQPDALG